MEHETPAREGSRTAAERLLSWPACLNVRDLGGFPVSGGGVTRQGAFVRMDNPCRLTVEGIHELIDYGVRTLVDLRASYELTIDPSPFAHPARHSDTVRYVH